MHFLIFNQVILKKIYLFQENYPDYQEEQSNINEDEQVMQSLEVNYTDATNKIINS